MITAEIKRLLRKKSLCMVTVCIFLLTLFWVVTSYTQSLNMISAGASYAESGMATLEPQQIFLSYMFQMSLTIYIFPFITMAVLFVNDDIKEKTLLQLAVINKKMRKWLLSKIVLYSAYVFVILCSLLILTTGMAFFFEQIDKTQWQRVFNPFLIGGLFLSWFGIVIIGTITMAITYVSGSAIAGNSFIVYLMLERIFTSGTALSLQSATLMKINEFLPWANLNSLFVYANNLQKLTGPDIDASSYMYLSMYHHVLYNEVLIVMPYFKPLIIIIVICTVYLILAIGGMLAGYYNRLKRM